MKVNLQDGFYAVVTPKDWDHPFVAGFIVKGGEVVEAAPVLRRRLRYWTGSPYVRWVSMGGRKHAKT